MLGLVESVSEMFGVVTGLIICPDRGKNYSLALAAVGGVHGVGLSLLLDSNVKLKVQI